MWRRQLTGVPRSQDWWAGVLFMIGSTFFALGSFQPYASTVGSGPDAITFAIGSIFFTTAATVQFAQQVGARRTSITHGFGAAWWASAVQLVGTVMFNISTFAATVSGLTVPQQDRAVWVPDMYGSIAFLVASYLSWLVVCGPRWAWHPRDDQWWIAVANFFGSIVFMMSALASVIVPATGQVLSPLLANLGTFLGALGFMLGGYLLLPAAARPATVD
ncbi:MAG TPA: hypothetical protein DCM67_02105 [Propionibacteriaceae bacterium]|nr:hypothetical protein [Propionibacteriaceae bacterium]